METRNRWFKKGKPMQDIEPVAWLHLPSLDVADDLISGCALIVFNVESSN